MTTPPSNSEADKNAALQDAEDFGRKEGGGAAARAAFYVTLVEWAQHQRIDVLDSELMWDRFSKGASAGSAMIGGVKLVNDKEDVRKVRVSECRQFIKMGSLFHSHRTDGVAVMDRGLKIIKQAKLDGRLKSKATDAMITVAREQNKDPGNELDDQTIETVIQPKEGVDKVEADALESIRVRLEATMKRFGHSDEVNDAAAYIQKRIDDLGGTSAYKRAQRALARKGV